jgi:hypothetical protein
MEYWTRHIGAGTIMMASYTFNTCSKGHNLQNNLRMTLMPIVRELESLQHIVPCNNDANEEEYANIFNSNNLDDCGGQILSQGMLVGMQFNTRCDEEWSSICSLLGGSIKVHCEKGEHVSEDKSIGKILSQRVATPKM